MNFKETKLSKQSKKHFTRSNIIGLIMKMNFRIASLAASIACIGINTAAIAQENLPYQKPPQSILELADVVRAPAVSMDTKKQMMLLTYRNTFKTLAELNQSELRLGGLRINPITNISSSTNYLNNLKVRKVSGGEEEQVKGLPKDPLIANISWSPNEKKIAFTHTTDRGVELWVIDVASAQAKKNQRRKCECQSG
jgi:hypothetical protein